MISRSSMKQSLFQHQFPNGLTLLGEPMPWLESVAFTLLIPTGTVDEPVDRKGLSGMTLEMMQRGAGDLDSRAIVEELDFLGVERASGVTTFHTSTSMACMASVLEPTLKIALSMFREPHFPDDEIEEARQSGLLELASLEDDPSQKCFTELKKARYGEIYGRIALGTEEGIAAISLADCKRFFANHISPCGAVLSIAGNFDWNTVRDIVGRLIDGWDVPNQIHSPRVVAHPSIVHLNHESQQTHIALAYDSVAYQHKDYYHGRGLIGILSDGMSSRLFSEVREKRGLVYSVSASAHSLHECGSVLCYAGTTAPRAQETLEVTIATIGSIGNGIDPQELSRLKSRVRTSLVMEQESSSARSSQIAYDWVYLGRVPTREQVLSEIERLTCESLVEHFHRYPPKNWSMVTIGPEPLVLPA
jgi:predicted Zn-dependent peptidase